MPHAHARISCRWHARARAFTLFELMVTVTLAAVLASMVLPLMRDDDHLKLMAAASILRSDIEYAQALSISKPSEPASVMFKDDTDSYYVAYASDYRHPMMRDDTGEAYTITLGQGRASAADGVNITTSNMDKGTVAFVSHGGLATFNTSPVITLQAGNEWFQLTIDAMTGSLTETSGTGAPP